MDDIELLNKCCLGDKKAWDCFVEQFTRLIYDTIIKSLNKYGHPFDKETINDLHNDVFVTLLKNNYRALRIFESRDKCQLSSYLSTITINRTIDYLRKCQRTVSINNDEEPLSKDCIQELAVFNTQEAIDRMDAILLVKHLMNRLNQKEKNLCQLYYIEGQKPKWIANKLNITVDYVYILKQRLLLKLKELIKKENNIKK